MRVFVCNICRHPIKGNNTTLNFVDNLNKVRVHVEVRPKGPGMDFGICVPCIKVILHEATRPPED